MKRYCKFLTILACAAGLTVFATAAMADEDNFSANAGDAFDFALPDPALFAQAPGDPEHQPGGRMHEPFGDPMQQRKHLEELRTLKMLELLNLTPEQEVPFLTAFNQMRQEQRGLDEQADVLLDSMATELQSNKPDEARLRDLVARTRALEKQKFEQLSTFIDKADKLLTVEQTAKLMIFQKRFEKELLERIGRFRRGGMQHDSPSDSGGF